MSGERWGGGGEVVGVRMGWGVGVDGVEGEWYGGEQRSDGLTTSFRKHFILI